MVRTLTLASVLALLPATAAAQDASADVMSAKAVEAEKTATGVIMPEIGLAAGTMAPTTQLTDSTGALVTLAELSGEKGTALVFFRSADWCPFCKKQLIDLEEAAEPLEEAGWTLAALSYDPRRSPECVSRQKAISHTLSCRIPILKPLGPLICSMRGQRKAHAPMAFRIRRSSLLAQMER